MLITQPLYIFYQNCLAHIIYCNPEHSMLDSVRIYFSILSKELKFIFKHTFPVHLGRQCPVRMNSSISGGIESLGV